MKKPVKEKAVRPTMGYPPPKQVLKGKRRRPESKLAEELERSQAQQRDTAKQMEELRRSMEATEAAAVAGAAAAAAASTTEAEVDAAVEHHERPTTAPRPSTRGSSERASSRAESLFGQTDASFGVPVRDPPPEPPGSPGNKQSYSRDEYVQAKLLHAKQLQRLNQLT